MVRILVAHVDGRVWYDDVSAVPGSGSLVVVGGETRRVLASMPEVLQVVVTDVVPRSGNEEPK